MGFFDLFADKTPEEPAEAQLTAYVQGKVQGGVPMVVCRGRQAAGIERIRRKPG